MSTINLASLPAPAVVESLDYETELQAKKNKLQEIDEDWDADTESDPSVKLLEVSAYSAVNERQRVNDAGKAVMLPWASGDDVDNLVAWMNITRNTITEATDDDDAVMESDSDFKNRGLEQWDMLTNAGTKASYKAHAKNASSSVKDAVGVCDSEGNITVYIMSYDDDGTPSDELIATVQTYFDNEDIYQLCTNITVAAATIIEFNISAELDISDSLLENTLVTSAAAAVQVYVDSVHYLGTKVSLSKLYTAVDLEGVSDSDLGSFVTLKPAENEVYYCTSITVTTADDEDE